MAEYDCPAQATASLWQCGNPTPRDPKAPQAGQAHQPPHRPALGLGPSRPGRQERQIALGRGLGEAPPGVLVPERVLPGHQGPP